MGLGKYIADVYRKKRTRAPEQVEYHREPMENEKARVEALIEELLAREPQKPMTKVRAAIMKAQVVAMSYNLTFDRRFELPPREEHVLPVTPERVAEMIHAAKVGGGLAPVGQLEHYQVYEYEKFAGLTKRGHKPITFHYLVVDLGQQGRVLFSNQRVGTPGAMPFLTTRRRLW